MSNKDETFKEMNEKTINVVLPDFKPLPEITNIPQNYISAFNTGMNIYQCLNYLQGFTQLTLDGLKQLIVDLKEYKAQLEIYLIQLEEKLQKEIDDEAQARKDADQALSDRIDKETEDRKQADKELSDKLDQEKQDREDADNSIKDDLNKTKEDLTDKINKLDGKFIPFVVDKEGKTLEDVSIEYKPSRTEANNIPYTYKPIDGEYSIHPDHSHPGTPIEIINTLRLKDQNGAGEVFNDSKISSGDFYQKTNDKEELSKVVGLSFETDDSKYNDPDLGETQLKSSFLFIKENNGLPLYVYESAKGDNEAKLHEIAYKDDITKETGSLSESVTNLETDIASLQADVLNVSNHYTVSDDETENQGLILRYKSSEELRLNRPKVVNQLSGESKEIAFTSDVAGTTYLGYVEIDSESSEKNIFNVSKQYGAYLIYAVYTDKTETQSLNEYLQGISLTTSSSDNGSTMLCMPYFGYGSCILEPQSTTKDSIKYAYAKITPISQSTALPVSGGLIGESIEDGKVLWMGVYGLG